MQSVDRSSHERTPLRTGAAGSKVRRETQMLCSDIHCHILMEDIFLTDCSCPGVMMAEIQRQACPGLDSFDSNFGSQTVLPNFPLNLSQ